MTQTNLFDNVGKILHIKRDIPSAAEIMAGRSGRLRSLVLHFVRKAVRAGLTDEEIAERIDALGVTCKYSSVVSARNSLVRDGHICDTGKRRLSPTSGIRVTVWGAAK